MSQQDDLVAMGRRLLMNNNRQAPIVMVRGEGCALFDADGRRYLDMTAGVAVSILGHGHPGLADAIAAQARRLVHVSNLYYIQAQLEFAEALSRRAFHGRAFFCNSGTEANEAALKLARRYQAVAKKQPERTEFVSFENSFHGRTFGSVSATYKAKYREPFGPVVPGVEFVRFNDVADLRAKFSDEVCAILVESIQGEGGIRPLSQEFFAAARELTESTGALLVVDEIQAGMGRTGKWCGYQHYGIRPDITTLAKPLAGGIPLGAMLCTEEVAKAIHPGMHGTTFGGGPLACAVAIAVIDTIEREGLLAHVVEVGDYFQGKLQELAKKHEAIVDVRGKGLMLAAELDSADLAKLTGQEMLKRKILINVTSDTVLRFLPPFILQKEHVDQAIAALDEIFTEHANSTAVGNTREVGGQVRG